MTRSAKDVLEQEFLQIRAKILEVAAFFDRLEAAELESEAIASSRQLDLLRGGVGLLGDDQGSKAERVQLLFSREYESAWREQFDV